MKIIKKWLQKKLNPQGWNRTFLLTIALASLAQFWFAHSYAFFSTPDSIYYLEGAAGLLEGKGFAEVPSFRLPLTSSFLALMKFLFFTPMNHGILFVFAIINIFSFYYIYKTIKLLSDSDLISSIVILFYSLNPGFFVSSSVYFGPANVGMFILSFTFYYIARYLADRKSTKNYCLSLLGAVLYSLTRGEGILLVFLVAFVAMASRLWKERQEGLKNIAKSAAVYLLIFALFTAPIIAWAGWNYVRADSFSLTTYGGLSLFWPIVWKGGFLDEKNATTAEILRSYRESSGDVASDKQSARPWRLRAFLVEEGYSEVEADAVMKKIAAAALRAHLWEYLQLYPSKLALATRNVLTYCNNFEPLAYVRMTNALTEDGVALPFVKDLRKSPTNEKAAEHIDYSRMVGSVDPLNYACTLYAHYLNEMLRNVTQVNEWIYLGLLLVSLALFWWHAKNRTALVVHFSIIMIMYLAILFYGDDYIHRLYVGYSPHLLSFIVLASTISIHTARTTLANIGQQRFRFSWLLFFAAAQLLLFGALLGGMAVNSITLVSEYLVR